MKRNQGRSSKKISQAMDKIPHTLGLDLVKQIDYFTTEVIESSEEKFTWLNEILETAKIAFQTPQIQTLPKTPSLKKRRGRKRKSEVPSFIRRSSIFQNSFDQSLNESYDAENVPPQLNASNSYSTRATLRTRQKNAESGISNTSALKTRNKRNTRNNTFNMSGLSPTKEIPESIVEKKQRVQVEEPKKAVKMASKEENMTKDTVTEKNSPVVCQTSTVQKETSLNNFSPPDKSPRLSVSTSNVGESRINNNSYVIETPSEEESVLNHPVITTSPAIVVISPKPESTDTDSGINSDDKEKVKPAPERSEYSDAKESSEEDAKSNTIKLSSSSAVSSAEASQPPKSRTRTRKQQQQQSVPAVLSPATYKESISSTTSTEVDDPPMQMTRSRARIKQPTNSSENSLLKASNEDKVEETRTRTRTRLQKRKSDEMEAKRDSEIKRPCIQTNSPKPARRCSDRLSGKTYATKEAHPEDADVSDTDDFDISKKETDKSYLYKTPQNISSSRTFLNMNSSYLNANRTPSQKSCTLYKYLQNNSFTSSGQKSGTQSRLNFITGNVKSFLKRNATPSKVVPIHNTQEQRKREFEEKEKKQQERLMKREEMQKKKLEERKKKREERMLKVAKSRQLKEIQDKEWKDQKNKYLEEKLSVTDRIREEKLREEREKLRSRLKKQQEAEERRNQEEEERVKKLKEQEEENQRQQAIFQRKKDYEEQERQRKAAEDKRKLEEQRERMLEAERERKNELERRMLEEERERERLKEREKEAARIRIETEIQRHRVAEQAQREKLRELEQARLMYEQQMSEKKNQRDQYISHVLQQPSVLSTVSTTLPSSCQKEEPKPAVQNTSVNTSYTSTTNSIQISPHKGSYTNYDIDNLKSDDSTDDESGPNKPVPKWASGPELKIALLMQYCNPPNLDHIFYPIELPDLNKLFMKKKSRFNRRTSSAVWDTPLPTSHLNIF